MFLLLLFISREKKRALQAFRLQKRRLNEAITGNEELQKSEQNLKEQV